MTTLPYKTPDGELTIDFNQNKPDDARFFIRLRNWERYQDMRGLKDGSRPKWIKLWMDVLLSENWIDGSDRDKVLMFALLVLAGKTGNRIRNNHSYLASVCGWDDADDVIEPFQELFASGIRGFFDLTLDPTPDSEREEMTKPTRAKPRVKNPAKRFDDFWKVYTNRKNKKEALAVWQRDNLDEHADEIIAAVKIQVTTDQWTKSDGDFIPLPSTYLNKERWKDEGTTVGRHSGDLPDNKPGERGY